MELLDLKFSFSFFFS
uniref:Uncharacterized protein n=1 Tax=Rhizophora mucronata TaxID=61149 RepID=A0A2P2NUX2_RHIMU